MLEQWWIELCIAEALALDVADLSLDADPQTLSARRQGQPVQDRVDAPRDAGGAEIGALLWEHRPREATRCSPIDCLALGQGDVRGSEFFYALCRGATPTTDFDGSELVRPRNIM